MMNITDLNTTEYANYYANYLDLVPKETTLIEGFKKGFHSVFEFFENIPAVKLNYAYAHEKWSVKEVFQHLIDTERIFQYRCFCIARQDKTPLPGFNQDDYIVPSEAKNKSMDALVAEFKTVRLSFLTLLESLNDSDLKSVGNVSGNAMSARAAAFIVLGHYLWHIDIISKRYL
ncbi:DinB family protein [Flavobacteriaceae bacterium GSB9]|nr:DinB family protein [Flavobacteriaceae bacterium GSB9]